MGGSSPKVKYGPAAYPVSQQIIGSAAIRGPLTSAISSDIINDPFANLASRQMTQAVQQIRGGYGARGLAGSGIAQKGETEAIQDLALKGAAQRAGQLTGLLGTASAPPSHPGGTPTQGGGFFGK